MLPKFGAYPQYPHSTFVRVWAPHVMGLGVIGDFCAWQAEQAVPLTAPANDYWEGVINGLGPGGRVRRANQCHSGTCWSLQGQRHH